MLRRGDEGLIPERMDYRYPPGAVRRLDDALLAAYGSAYVVLRGNAHRRAALESRLDRLTGNTLGSQQPRQSATSTWTWSRCSSTAATSGARPDVSTS